ncbi:hypothetical protein HMPREF3038_01172 [Akkermansia sp. KLE1797]|nr:hypothetical protein HMPREF3038_01172 [Akkermansia sp. KLE1797]KZA05154.1 hypothetical protein HMPREF1326_01190 [Akkermansia sp. KLE1605]
MTREFLSFGNRSSPSLPTYSADFPEKPSFREERLYGLPVPSSNHPRPFNSRLKHILRNALTSSSAGKKPPHFLSKGKNTGTPPGQHPCGTYRGKWCNAARPS